MSADTPTQHFWDSWKSVFSRGKEKKVSVKQPSLYEYLNAHTPSGYDDEVAAIKQLRTKREGNSPVDLRAEVKGKITELRGRVERNQLRNIRLQQVFFAFMEQSLDHSDKELELFFHNEHLSREELKQLLMTLSAFDKRRDKVERVRDLLFRAFKEKYPELKEYQTDQKKDLPDVISRDLGQELFLKITGKKAKGIVTIEIRPFALLLHIYEAGDFKETLEGWSSVPGGYYKDQKNYYFSKILGVGIDFPFIAVDESKMTYYKTKPHEEAHGVNRAISDGLKQNQKHFEIWGGVAISTSNVPGWEEKGRAIVRKAMQSYEKGYIDAKQLEEKLRSAMFLVLAEAVANGKDEIIADFIAAKNFSHKENVQMQRVAEVQRKNKTNEPLLYKYFEAISLNASDFFDDSELTKVYDQLAKEYNEIYDDNVGFIANIWGNRIRFSDPDKRNELTAFMRQNPLNTWRIRGKKLYGKENQTLSKLIERGDAFDKSIQEAKNNLNSLERFGQDTEQDQWLQEKEITHGGKEIENRAKNTLVLLSNLNRFYKDDERHFSHEKLEYLSDENDQNTQEFKMRLQEIQFEVENIEWLKSETTQAITRQIIEKTSNHVVLQEIEIANFSIDGAQGNAVQLMDTLFKKLKEDISLLEAKVEQPEGRGDENVSCWNELYLFITDQPLSQTFSEKNPRLAQFIVNELGPLYRQRSSQADQVLNANKLLGEKKLKIVDKINIECMKKVGKYYKQAKHLILDKRWFLDLLDAELASIEGGQVFLALKAKLEDDLIALNETNIKIHEQVVEFLAA